MTMKSDAQFEEKLTCGLEMTWRIGQLFVQLYYIMFIYNYFLHL